MAHNLKTLPFLMKKDSQESNPRINNEQQRWDNQETAHFSGSCPSSSSATQQASQDLPVLMISPAPVTTRIQPPVLVLPDLAEKRAARTPRGGAPQKDIENGLKETPPLARVAHNKKKLLFLKKQESDNQESANFSGSCPFRFSSRQKASQVLPELIIFPAAMTIRKKGSASSAGASSYGRERRWQNTSGDSSQADEEWPERDPFLGKGAREGKDSREQPRPGESTCSRYHPALISRNVLKMSLQDPCPS